MQRKHAPLEPTFEMFLRAKRQRGTHGQPCTEATLDWYRIALTQFAAWLAAHKRQGTMTDLDRERVEAFVDAQATPDKQRHVAVALKSFASWLHASELTPENRLERLIIPKVPEKTRDELNEAEVGSAIAATSGGRNVLRDRALLHVFFLCGLRLNEALLLELRDVDLDNAVLRLRAETTKGKRRGRLVTLWPQAADALERYLRERDISSERERVFTTDEGKPLSYGGMKQIFQRLRTRSGVARLTPHHARHTAISAFFRAGSGDREQGRREFWGRGSDHRMMDRYDHFEPAAERLNRPSPMRGLRRAIGRRAQLVASR
jgi:site-specific recombinase XerD